MSMYTKLRAFLFQLKSRGNKVLRKRGTTYKYCNLFSFLAIYQILFENIFQFLDELILTKYVKFRVQRNHFATCTEIINSIPAYHSKKTNKWY